MTKSSYGIIAILLLILTSFLSFKTPAIIQAVYPTNTAAPTKVPDSCTGAVKCDPPSYATIPGECSCTHNGSYFVTVRCQPLGGGAYETCTQACQPSSACGPTLAWEGCMVCQRTDPPPMAWNYVPQNDCAGSSCGCNQRRTTAQYCNGTHCYDTCVTDMSCTAECTVVPSATPTTYYPPVDPSTPIYYGTLRAKAVTVSAADTSCSALVASTDYLQGTLITFSPYIGDAKLQTNSVLSWPFVATTGLTVYGVSSTPPGQYAPGNVCVSANGGAYTQATAGALTANGVLDFVIGYLPQSGWVQTVGGDVYATNSLLASIPASAGTYFNLVSAMGDAGIVSYGSTYDFSLGLDFGEEFVSAKKWLVRSMNTVIDYYEHFTKQMDVPESATAINVPLNLAKPAACATGPCVYYVNGNMTTSTTSPWAVAAGEQTIIFVNGNVTIHRNISLASTGFFALVVNGNITVDPVVTVLEGVYIASNATGNATFSSGAGTTQLVVTGSVIADNFSLERDLGGALNPTTPGEVFTFDPQLLFSMPDAMKETPYIWQEVAP